MMVFSPLVIGQDGAARDRLRVSNVPRRRGLVAGSRERKRKDHRYPKIDTEGEGNANRGIFTGARLSVDCSTSELPESAKTGLASIKAVRRTVTPAEMDKTVCFGSARVAGRSSFHLKARSLTKERYFSPYHKSGIKGKVFLLFIFIYLFNTKKGREAKICG